MSLATISRFLLLCMALLAIVGAAHAQGGQYSTIQSSVEPLPNCVPAVTGQLQPIIWDVTAGEVMTCTAPNTWSPLGGGGGGGTPCITIPSSLQYNNSGAFGCEPDLIFTTPHTIAFQSPGIFNSLGTFNFLGTQNLGSSASPGTLSWYTGDAYPVNLTLPNTPSGAPVAGKMLFSLASRPQVSGECAYWASLSTEIEAYNQGNCGQIPVGLAGGSVNAMTATVGGGVLTGAIGDGFDFIVIPNLANTSSTPTLQINAISPITIQKCGGQPLVAGDYATNVPALLIYSPDGDFQLQNPLTTPCVTAIPFALLTAGTNTDPGTFTLSGQLNVPQIGDASHFVNAIFTDAININSPQVQWFGQLATPCTTPTGFQIGSICVVGPDTVPQLWNPNSSTFRDLMSRDGGTFTPGDALCVGTSAPDATDCGTPIIAYTHTGTVLSASHTVQDTGTLSGGTLAVTLSGLAVFTSNATYNCKATDRTTPANSVLPTLTSGTSITFNGTSTDAFNYTCWGN